jgi:hypothetical protein
MGYIPLLLTFSAFLVLFVLIFNQAIIQRKKQLLLLQQTVRKGLIASGIAVADEPDLSAAGQQSFESAYIKWKSSGIKNKDKEAELKNPYLQYKLQLAKYNKLIIRKPYSFAATILGHKPIHA